MITKEQLTKLFHWGNKTTFPLRKEGITSKYMGYDVFVSYAKYGKNEKRYRKKLFDDDIYEIIKNDEIYGLHILNIQHTLMQNHIRILIYGVKIS